ncbi:MAG TPA: hypothetical protein VIC32_06810 [Terriglobales bacterium]|jgi:signal transduction histidine kinase
MSAAEVALVMHEDRESAAGALAQAMHRGPAQSVAAALMQLESISAQASAERQNAECDALRATLLHLADELNSLTVALRPPILDHCGLAAALESLAESFSESGPVAAQVIDDHARREPRPGDLALYRMAEHALAGIRQRGQARRATLELGRRGRLRWLQVRDDGVLLASAAEPRTAWLRELAIALRGCYFHSSAIGQGTCVEMAVPIEMHPIAAQRRDTR